MMPYQTCGRYHEPEDPCSTQGNSLQRYLDACQEAVQAWDDAELWLSDATWYGQKGQYGQMVMSSKRAGKAQAQARQAMWAAENAL